MRLPLSTVDAVTGMMEYIMNKQLRAISARGGRLQGATIKCRWEQDLTFQLLVLYTVVSPLFSGGEATGWRLDLEKELLCTPICAYSHIVS